MAVSSYLPHYKKLFFQVLELNLFLIVTRNGRWQKADGRREEKLTDGYKSQFKEIFFSRSLSARKQGIFIQSHVFKRENLLPSALVLLPSERSFGSQLDVLASKTAYAS